MKREFRITRTIDFKRVRREGRSYAHPLLVLTIASGSSDNSRVGFITGKAIGNAVKRNHVKRQLRSIFSEFLPSLTNQYDLVVVARHPIVATDFSLIKQAIKQLLLKAQVLLAEENDTKRTAS